MSVATYAAIAFGWLLLVLLDEIGLLEWLGLLQPGVQETSLGFRLIGMTTCPFAAAGRASRIVRRGRFALRRDLSTAKWSSPS